MEAYTILAKYYDSLMKDFNYDAYLEFIKGYVKGEGVDLCCGTGEMTIRLAKQKCKMIGMDLSQDMLNVARDKARKNFQNIIFIQENVIDFDLPHKVDFVTCVCDGLNYINDEDMKKAIKNIAGKIKPNGYFIFDISSQYKLENILANNTFCEDTNKATYIWSNKLEKDKISMQVSFFEKIKGDTYRRIDENQVQYVHNLDLVKSMLEDFEYKVFDGTTFDEVKDNSQRLLFIAKRK